MAKKLGNFGRRNLMRTVLRTKLRVDFEELSG